MSSLQIGNAYSLYIETIVREDSIKLFGFTSIEEKELFVVLQSVNGVGAKMSLNIISNVGLNDLYQAIMSRDKSVLLGVSGVGNKIAERIIIELKGKKIFSNAIIGRQEGFSNDFQDAISALVALGIGRNQASSYVEKILLDAPEAKIDDIIKQALILRNQ